MHGIRIILIGAVGAFACTALISPSLAAGTKTAASGETQIVARLDGREITVSDLRSELARLGRSPNDKEAERVALENIINRSLLAAAAREAKVHRRPEALRRMAIAQEQALADLYVATTSQPPEPILTEIEDFVRQNPSLFGDRRVYTFSVLSLPADSFDSDRLTPLFDESEDFAALVKTLKKNKIRFSETPIVQPSSAFPVAVRNQLAQYGLHDNIVIQSETDTIIMKISAIAPAPVPASDALVMARQILLQQSAQSRAEGMLAALKNKSSLSYYRASAAPPPKDTEAESR